MSRRNKIDSDFLAGLVHEAITKRLSGVGRAFFLLSAVYIVKKNNHREKSHPYT